MVKLVIRAAVLSLRGVTASGLVVSATVGAALVPAVSVGRVTLCAAAEAGRGYTRPAVGVYAAELVVYNAPITKGLSSVIVGSNSDAEADGLSL